MKQAVVLSASVISPKEGNQLIALELSSGERIIRTFPLIEADLRGSGFMLEDNSSELPKGFESITFPKLPGLIVRGDWKSHKAGDEFVDMNGNTRQYRRDGWHVEGSRFLTFSIPSEF